MNEKAISQWLLEHGITSERPSTNVGGLSPLEIEVMLGSIKALDKAKVRGLVGENPSRDLLAKISLLDIYFIATQRVDEGAYKVIADPAVSPVQVCDYICFASGPGLFSLNLPTAGVEDIYWGTFSYLNRVHAGTPNSLVTLFYSALESHLNSGLREHMARSRGNYQAIPNTNSIADIYMISVMRDTEKAPFSLAACNDRLMKALRINPKYQYLKSLLKIEEHFCPAYV